MCLGGNYVRFYPTCAAKQTTLVLVKQPCTMPTEDAKWQTCRLHFNISQPNFQWFVIWRSDKTGWKSTVSSTSARTCWVANSASFMACSNSFLFWSLRGVRVTKIRNRFISGWKKWRAETPIRQVCTAFWRPRIWSFHRGELAPLMNRLADPKNSTSSARQSQVSHRKRLKIVRSYATHKWDKRWHN